MCPECHGEGWEGNEVANEISNDFYLIIIVVMNAGQSN